MTQCHHPDRGDAVAEPIRGPGAGVKLGGGAGVKPSGGAGVKPGGGEYMSYAHTAEVDE